MTTGIPLTEIGVREIVPIVAMMPRHS